MLEQWKAGKPGRACGLCGKLLPGLAAVLFCAAWLRAPSAFPDAAFPDDHGDAPAESTLLLPGAAPSVSTIEMDTDRDWFHFVGLPGAAYAVEVTASSIWDVVVEVRGPAGYPLLAAADSAMSAAPPRAEAAWSNSAPAATFYVGISGYLKFTTGLYTVAIHPLNWTDSDEDGLPDSWEMQHLETLDWTAEDDSDGDGASNLHELYAMTNPGFNRSVLRIASITNAADAVTFQWPGAPHAAYRVRKAARADASAWTTVGTNSNSTAEPATLYWSDPEDATTRVYRVELVIAR